MATLDEIKDIPAYKEFSKISGKITNDLLKSINKHFKAHPKETVICAMHAPLNMMLNLVRNDKEGLLQKIFPDLPGCFIRMLKPMEKIEDKWGTMPNEEFIELYHFFYSKMQLPLEEIEKAAVQHAYDETKAKEALIKKGLI